MTHLDLFSGIGGFSAGLKQAGFPITKTYFAEIDKHAIAVYKHNFKNSTHVKSVTDVRGRDLGQIDIITFGSPCQDFSLAGKRTGLGGERSSLIREAIRLIKECKPRFFVWENVKGTFSSNNRNDFTAILQAFANIGGYRLEWQLLNTKWFLPQNRERIYLVGYLGGRSGGQVFPITENRRPTHDVQRQQDDTCTLTTRYNATGNGSYIIERKQHAQKEVAGTLRTHHDGRGFRATSDGDSPTIPARAREDGSGQPVVRVNANTKKGYEEASEGDSINYSVPSSKTRRGCVGYGVAQTLDTACNQAVIGALRGRNPDNPADRSPGAKLKQTLELNSQGVSNSLSTVTKDNVVVSDRIRRLTPIECERLQGFPDNWTLMGDYEDGTKEVSDAQRYKMCGNAVTVEVVRQVGLRIKDVLL